MEQENKKPQNYAFIDSQNLNLGVRKFGWKMDWQRFRRFLADEYGVSKAFMFIGYIPEFEKMYAQLHDAGYAVVLKPTYDMTKPRKEEPKTAEEDKKPVKGNIDAELVLWAVKEKNNYEKAVIVSGDGDFYCLIEYLDEEGKLLKVLTPNSYYSGLFNKYESYVEDLGKSRRELAHHDRPKKGGSKKPNAPKGHEK